MDNRNESVLGLVLAVVGVLYQRPPRRRSIGSLQTKIRLVTLLKSDIQSKKRGCLNVETASFNL